MKRYAIAALVALALAGLAILGGLLAWSRAVDAFATRAYGPAVETVVEVRSGATVDEVAETLASAGVVSDARRFLWLARRLGRDRQIKAGEYAFRGAVEPVRILDQLAQGRVKLHSCTVPEGLSLTEVARVLERCGLGRADELLGFARDPGFAHRAGVPADSLEGYLFPDTYAFPRNPRPEAVLLRLVGRFHEEWRRALASVGTEHPVSMHAAVTLASLLETETSDPQARRRIACALHAATHPGAVVASAREAPTVALPAAPVASPGADALAIAVAPSGCGGR